MENKGETHFLRHQLDTKSKEIFDLKLKLSKIEDEYSEKLSMKDVEICDLKMKNKEIEIKLRLYES